MGATFLALLAIFVWSGLAVLGAGVASFSPFLTVGIALCVGGMAGIWKAREWRVPFRTFAVGVGGIFGYHALLFAAFRISPVIEANLINYLWPLLIVVLSPLILPGFRLAPRHAVGAVLGLAGAALVVTGGKLSLDAAYLPGYLLAASAALIWACYSLLTKRLPPFPTGAVGGFCLASGLASLLLYLVESRLAPGDAMPPTIGAADWIRLVLLGLGPMGGAFYAWDAALKRGDPRVIGALSYLTPLLSTLNLVIVGGKRLTAVTGAAAALIVAGAAIGSLDLIRAALGRTGRSRRGRNTAGN